MKKDTAFSKALKKINYQKNSTIKELFEKQAARTPHNIAVVFEGKSLTYRQLNEKANQLAHHLQKHKIGPETLICLYLERGLEMAIAILGVVKAGGAYVPIDLRYPKARLEYILKDTKTSVLLTTTSFQTQLDKDIDNEIKRNIHFFFLDESWQKISKLSNSNPATAIKSENLLYVIYTSGTTGNPKGVMIEHRQLSRLFSATDKWFHFNEKDIWTLFHSYAFDFSVWEYWGALLFGGKLVIVPYLVSRSPDDFYKLLVQEKVTILNQTPSAFYTLIDYDLTRKLQELHNLRFVIFGGEALDFEILKPWFKKYGYQQPTLINMYGITETTVHVTYRPIFKKDVENPRGSLIGVAIPDLSLQVFDPSQKRVPIGTQGELYVGGAGVARGYLNRPDLNKEKFIQNPFKPNEKIYRTGDLVCSLPDGDMNFIGRVDEQIKLRGYRIEPGEIASALQKCTNVTQAAVILRKDIPKKQYLAAYLVLREMVKKTKQLIFIKTIKKELAKTLPDYMIPTTFNILDKMPLTPNGKLNRKALPKPEITTEVSRSYIAPKNEVEKKLATLWQDLLGIKKVGIQDNFFDLGGHSLTVIELITSIRTDFQVEIPFNAVFNSPTIKGLTKLINALPKVTPTSFAVKKEIVSKRIPLSFAQQRLWFLDKLIPNSPMYNLPTAARLHGKVDKNNLEKALQAVIDRHGVLRTCFPDEHGEPFQDIKNNSKFCLKYQDLSKISPKKHEMILAAEVKEESLQPFNLSKLPLIRAKLIKLNNQEYFLIFNMHHIVSDGWSMEIFTHELSSFYNAYLLKTEPKLKPLPYQYTDFALWQRQWLQEKVLEKQINYWKKELAGIPEMIELPYQKTLAISHGYSVSNYTHTLSKEISQELKTLSRKQNTTMFITLLTIFHILLHRYSQQESVVIGTPVANRHYEKVESLIGFFVNTLAIRMDIIDQPTFLETLQQIKQKVLHAYEFQDLPFEQLVDYLQVNRTNSHNPIFQVMFLMDEWKTPEQLQLSNIKVESYRCQNQIARFDLTLTAKEAPTRIILEFEYVKELFDEALFKNMAKHFSNLTAEILKNPKQKVDLFPILTSKEKQIQLLSWNDTKKKYPQDKTILQYFEELAEKHPHKEALVFENKSLSYAVLNQKANQVANYLLGKSIGVEKLVPLFAERSLEMVIGILGIVKAGAAYVPLDPEYPADRLGTMLEDTESSLIILSARKLEEKLPQEYLKRKKIQTIALDEDWQQAFEKQVATNPPQKITGKNAVYVIFTSGSTGKPKGVINIHEGLLNRIQWMHEEYQLRPSDRVLQKTPFTFDVSVWEFFWPLMVGATLVVSPPGAHRDPELLSKIIQKQKITTLHFVPSMLDLFIASAGVNKCHTIRQVFASGEALSFDSAQRFFTKLKAKLHNLYGPTEASIDVSYWECKPNTSLTIVPIGRPIANTTLYILDKYLQLMPAGATGELYIGGIGLARGYLNRPDLTKERFIPDPFSTKKNARLYKTGDLVRYLKDGNIEYLGRIDFQVKLRGLRIELGEIEAELLKIPGMQQAVVLLREDMPGTKYLAAYLVHTKGKDILSTNNSYSQFIESVRKTLSKGLPEYMVPTTFTLLNELPLNPNGKLDRKALPTPLLEKKVKEYIKPRNEIEQMLLGVWCKVLNMKQISIDDNFFSLGGDSLLTVKLVIEAGKLGLKFSVAQTFNTPTIEQLATAIKSSKKAIAKKILTNEMIKQVDIKLEAKTLKSQGIEQAYLLSATQLYIIENYGKIAGDLGTYHYQEAFLIEDKTLNLEELKNSINIVVQRHPLLRTSFVMNAPRPYQIVRKKVTLPLQELDFSNIPQHRWREQIQKIMDDEILSELFNVNDPKALLYRMHVVRCSSTECFIIVSYHHAIIDGWSNIEVLKEIILTYQSLKAHAFIAIKPEKINSYRELVALEQKIWTTSKEKNFWQKKLKHIDLSPTLHKLKIAQNFPIITPCIQGIVNESIGDQLLEIANKEGFPVRVLFLTAYLQLLADSIEKNKKALITGIVTNRRTDELTNPFSTVGYFWNMVPYIYERSKGESVEPMKVHQLLNELEPHGKYPLKKILQDLKLAASQELFQTSFNFVHFHNAREMQLSISDKENNLSVQFFCSQDKYHYLLNLACSQSPIKNEFEIFLNFNHLYFTKKQAEDLYTHYIKNLKRIAGNE